MAGGDCPRLAAVVGVRLSKEKNGQHHITNPNRYRLEPFAVLSDIALNFGKTKEDVPSEIFG